MKHNIMLIVASLLTLPLAIIHLTQDIMRQAEGTNMFPIPVVIFAVSLYGTLIGERLRGEPSFEAFVRTKG
jgi:hypothetical protein